MPSLARGRNLLHRKRSAQPSARHLNFDQSRIRAAISTWPRASSAFDLDQSKRHPAVVEWIASRIWITRPPDPRLMFGANELSTAVVRMFRFIALVVVCMVSLLWLGEASWAHENRAAREQVSPAMHSTVIMTSAGEDGCLPRHACCQTVCAQCQVSQHPYRCDIIRASLTSAVIVVSLEDHVHSVIVGRDPPVPKGRLL